LESEGKPREAGLTASLSFSNSNTNLLSLIGQVDWFAGLGRT